MELLLRVCARAAWGTAMIKICLVTTTDTLDVLIPGEPARRSGMMPPTSACHRHVAAGHAASPPWATAERCGVRAMNAAEIACALGDARRPGRVWRCLCPLHGGHSLLRATAVKFSLTMAPTAWLPKLLSSPIQWDRYPPSWPSQTAPAWASITSPRRWHEFSATCWQIDESAPIDEGCVA
jgi:hypothetical protein